MLLLRLFLTLTLLCLSLSFCGLIPYASAQDQKQAEIRAAIAKGNSLMARNLYKQAVDEYEKCLEIDPENSYAKSNIVLAHNNWGIYHFNQGQYDLAKEQWQCALRLNPGDRLARYNLNVWQKTMARLGKSSDLNANRQVDEDDLSPPEPAVIILAPGKQPDQANKTGSSNAETDSIEPNRNEKVSETAHVSENKNVSPANSSAPPLEKYYDPGTDSGAKILPRKAEESGNPLKIDESINRLETKIYGQPRNEASVLKRLERMELDTFGKVNDAPITERVAKLKRYFSLED